MQVLYERCAGLDVHKNSVFAGVRKVFEGKVCHEVRKFGTMTKDLLELSDWLSSEGCSHVAMESTGVYWKPVWHILEGNFELILANAQHVRNVPGRKSDVNDAIWLSDLLAHGLIRSSFVPPRDVQEARDLTRTRKQMVRDSVQHVQRIQKLLEDANIKLSSVISNIAGKSGRAFLKALAQGITDPSVLATLTCSNLKCSQEELVESLRGHFLVHHQFLLNLHLQQLESIEAAIAHIDERIEETVRPLHDAAQLLTTIPGVAEVASMIIVSEIGVDMSRFPSSGHLLSWAGLCPKLNESAGKKKSTRIKDGAPWLKTTLVQCAWAATRTKNSYYKAQYHRIKARRGHKKALIAVAASILTAIYHMLERQNKFQDLGGDYFGQLNTEKTAQRLRRRIEQLGYEVEMKKAG